MNPVVVTEIARDSHRAVAAVPKSMFVVTVGAVGNVNPKFTLAVDDDNVTNVNVVVPRRVQF